MIRVLRALLDGLVLRCPRCRQGRMFLSLFKMRKECPVCGMPFEKSSGEITGGMGINTVVTQALVIALALLGWFTTIPLLPLMAGIVAIAIVFPILFYPISRGLWASVIYLTGDNEEPD
jgi:uncharacterized protein (DUF983 family)